MDNSPVHCEPSEAAYFNPPPGSSCGTYAQNFLAQAGGYLINPNATAECGYCAYESGEDFMRTLNIEPRDKWRYFGIFLGFCISNWFLIYFFIYTVRVRGWTFGFGPLFRGIGKASDLLAKPFKRSAKKEEK